MAEEVLCSGAFLDKSKRRLDQTKGRGLNRRGLF